MFVSLLQGSANTILDDKEKLPVMQEGFSLYPGLFISHHLFTEL
jgi:hypothetical protein